MEKIKISIEGFKCFDENQDFYLNNLTLLTGANSAGKSTVIQSLLLTQTISESKSTDGQMVDLNLNNPKYALELGKYDDIVNRDNNYHNVFFTGSKDIGFAINNAKAIIKADDNEDANKSVKVAVDNNFSFDFNNFVYLNAYRMAPQYEYKTSKQTDYCDCHGTNTGDVIHKHSNDNCEKNRSLDFSGDKKWNIQLDEWISYIFPNISIQILPTSTESYQVKVLGNAATNVGFGITYALPILVSGLLVPEGGMLIVENPEAHLHGKAQSNMGYFLARMAAAGVRVVVETHSEHIVNGIRRMATEKESLLKADDLTIYFFKKQEDGQNIIEITMDNKGNLSDYPVDFFDQVRQDTLAVLRNTKTTN